MRTNGKDHEVKPRDYCRPKDGNRIAQDVNIT